MYCRKRESPLVGSDRSLFLTILDVLVGHVWIVVKGTLIRGELSVLYVQTKSSYLHVVQPDDYQFDDDKDQYSNNK